MNAKFKCLKCGYKWKQEPAMVTCPECGHKYIKWTNYENMHKKHFNKMMKKEGVIRFGPTDRMVDYLRAMDAYVLPSQTETSSLSTMEAMACGVPVFVTGVGETGRYVKERRTGFKFGIGDHQTLAKKIMRVMDDKKKLREIGKRARSLIIKEYNWTRTKSDILKEFRKITD